MLSNGVLNIQVDRDDVKNVQNSAGYPIKPSFQVNGNLVFQSTGDGDHDGDDHSGTAILNGDLPFLPPELQPAIDQMLRHGIVFQAMHQHFYDWNPMIWYRINPYLNVATTVAFEPLPGKTAGAVDFGMVSDETQAVTAVMRAQDWQVGCLYNQETAESPQLFWAHQFKAGDAYALAREVRRGLDRMDLEFMS